MPGLIIGKNTFTLELQAIVGGKHPQIFFIFSWSSDLQAPFSFALEHPLRLAIVSMQGNARAYKLKCQFLAVKEQL